MSILELIEEKRVKRHMSIKNKIILENSFYHITQRAPGKEKLFLEEGDFLYFLFLLKKTAKDFNIDIHSFALMPNHLHLLIYLHERNLDKAMKKIFQKYAIYFNHKYQRKGHVFCGVYRAALCNDDSYILTASLYIHLNPLKAGLVTDLGQYRWSSVSLYCNPLNNSFIKTDFILGLLDRDKSRAVKQYSELLAECKSVKFTPLLENLRGLDKIFKNIFRKITLLIKKHKDDGKFLEDINKLEKQIENIKDKKRLSNPRDKEAVAYTIEQLKSRGFAINEICRILKISRFKIYRLCNISVPN